MTARDPAVLVAETRERLAAATPGPWDWIEDHGRDIADEGWSSVRVIGHGDPKAMRYPVVAETAHPVMYGDGESESDDAQADADLIAHAPADLAALCDVVGDLTRQLAALRHDGDPATLRPYSERPFRIDRGPAQPWEGNGPCQDCGSRNPGWVTPSVMWNKVMRDGDRANPDKVGVVCPTCFIIRAYEAGLDNSWWLNYEDAAVLLVKVERENAELRAAVAQARERDAQAIEALNYPGLTGVEATAYRNALLAAARLVRDGAP